MKSRHVKTLAFLWGSVSIENRSFFNIMLKLILHKLTFYSDLVKYDNFFNSFFLLIIKIILFYIPLIDYFVNTLYPSNTHN